MVLGDPCKRVIQHPQGVDLNPQIENTGLEFPTTEQRLVMCQPLDSGSVPLTLLTTQGVDSSGISGTKQEPERESAFPNSPAVNRKPNMRSNQWTLSSLGTLAKSSMPCPATH